MDIPCIVLYIIGRSRFVNVPEIVLNYDKVIYKRATQHNNIDTPNKGHLMGRHKLKFRGK